MNLTAEVRSEEKKGTIDICAWVSQNLPKIKAHARKYLAYSPYELEEFIQAAYEAAILAERSDGYEYEQSFWFHFRKSCLNMTYSHGDKNIKCYHEEYREFGDDDSPPTYIQYSTYAQEDKEDAHSLEQELYRNSLVYEALNCMTSKEREVWELLLKGLGLKKIATHLGKSKTAVIKLRDSGKKRTVGKTTGKRMADERRIRKYFK